MYLEGGDKLNKRLKELRTNLKLSQEELGNSIGIKSRAHISSLENGTRTITDRIINDICKTYNVNENWFRTGEGEMFVPIDADDEYFAAATEISNDNDEFAMAAVIEYWKLDKESKKAIRNYITSLANIVKEQE